jgi:membrane associated rhomboid family serine protease
MRRTWEDGPEFSGGVSFPSPTPVTRRLLWINGIVFLLFAVLVHTTRPSGLSATAGAGVGQEVMDWFALDVGAWRSRVPPVWQLLTYGFLHSVDDPWHILMNLLALFFFGTMLEGIVGSRRFLWVYLAAIAIGGAAELTGALVRGSSPKIVGASAGVFCVIVATAVMQPNARVIFILVPLTLKVLAAIMVGLQAFYLLTRGADGSTAILAHLGGAAWGYLAARRRWIWWDPLDAWHARVARSERANREQDHERLERLLAQIHAKGIHTLSRRDKAFLKRVSERKSSER